MSDLPFLCSNKAVADGAISYYIDHFVQTRVTKLTYGSKGSIDYNSSDSEHRKRPTFTAISGVKRIDNVFWVILSGVSYFLFYLKPRKRLVITPLCYAEQASTGNE